MVLWSTVHYKFDVKEKFKNHFKSGKNGRVGVTKVRGRILREMNDNVSSTVFFKFQHCQHILILFV